MGKLASPSLRTKEKSGFSCWKKLGLNYMEATLSLNQAVRLRYSLVSHKNAVRFTDMMTGLKQIYGRKWSTEMRGLI